jgi:hypothetical protein
VPAASSDGPPNPVSQPCPSQIPTATALSAGANTFAKAFATPPPGSIRASDAIRNLRSARAIRGAGHSGFLKPFVTAQYRYN